MRYFEALENVSVGVDCDTPIALAMPVPPKSLTASHCNMDESGILHLLFSGKYVTEQS